MKGLVEFLRGRKQTLVRTVEFQVQGYDPTYGPRTENMSIEVIDFDALLAAIDEFSEGFRT
jgi:hypothetical protein